MSVQGLPRTATAAIENSVLDDAECITDAACDCRRQTAWPQHDGVCLSIAAGNTPLANTTTGMCEADGDSDGVADGERRLP